MKCHMGFLLEISSLPLLEGQSVLNLAVACATAKLIEGFR